MMRPALIMSWMCEPTVRRPPQDGRPAPLLSLVIGLAAVGKGKPFPRTPKDVSAAEVEASPYDGRSIRAGRGRWLGYVVTASVFSSYDEARGLCEQLHFVRPNV